MLFVLYPPNHLSLFYMHRITMKKTKLPEVRGASTKYTSRGNKAALGKALTSVLQDGRTQKEASEMFNVPTSTINE